MYDNGGPQNNKLYVCLEGKKRLKEIITISKLYIPVVIIIKSIILLLIL
jgi:hypothetical protein